MWGRGRIREVVALVGKSTIREIQAHGRQPRPHDLCNTNHPNNQEENSVRQKLFWDRESRQWVEFRPSYDPTIHIIPDETGPFQSQADGKWYSSKSAYRREIKARGYEELGNDRPTFERKKFEISVNDLKRTAGEMGVSF